MCSAPVQDGDEKLQSSPVETDLGILVENDSKVLTANRSICTWRVDQAQHCYLVKGRYYSSLLFPGVVSFEHCLQFWLPKHEKDIKLLENARWRSVKMVKKESKTLKDWPQVPHEGSRAIDAGLW